MECVGCADRSAFDLTQHTKVTGVRMAAEKKLPEPRTIDVVGVYFSHFAILNILQFKVMYSESKIFNV